MKLIVDNSFYGKTAFNLDASTDDFWTIYKWAGLGFIASFILYSASLVLLISHAAPAVPDMNTKWQVLAPIIPILLLGFTAYIWVFIIPLCVYMDVTMSNLI